MPAKVLDVRKLTAKLTDVIHSSIGNFAGLHKLSDQCYSSVSKWRHFCLQPSAEELQD